MAFVVLLGAPEAEMGRLGTKLSVAILLEYREAQKSSLLHGLTLHS
uniref:Uncharacterized protein n=1 Tax=Pseudomonas fluorescens (strain SBW25) TaxID=216595 RepID=A0A0G4E5Q1_PSEFS|nr:hypothetical protein PQBR55_0187 [Pseudomonas fluorescens SBW25]